MTSLTGALLIIGAGSALGYLAAHSLRERCRLLQLWIWVVEILKTEICFQSRLLPEVLRRVAELVDDPEIGKAFQELAQAVEYGADLDFTGAWRQFAAAPVWRALKPPERGILRELGAFLGSTGREDQLAKLNSCKSQLEQICQIAEADNRKQAGLYRYLGFAAGAALVLWLG